MQDLHNSPESDIRFEFELNFSSSLSSSSGEQSYFLHTQEPFPDSPPSIFHTTPSLTVSGMRRHRTRSVTSALKGSRGKRAPKKKPADDNASANPKRDVLAKTDQVRPIGKSLSDEIRESLSDDIFDDVDLKALGGADACAPVATVTVPQPPLVPTNGKEGSSYGNPKKAGSDAQRRVVNPYAKQSAASGDLGDSLARGLKQGTVNKNISDEIQRE